MPRLYLLWALAALVLQARPSPHVIDIPALSFGKNRWSVIKITNNSDTPRPVSVDVFSEHGQKLPMSGTFALKPRETRELRIDPGSDKPRELCWAQIIDPYGDQAVSATATLEMLRGNSIEEFERPPHVPSSETRWVTPASLVQNKDVYFLNASNKSINVGFCTLKEQVAPKCGRNAQNFKLKPGQSLVLAVGSLNGQFFLTQASAPGRAFVTVLVPGLGERKVFSSDSSIRFDDTAGQ
jgi:hypothetical protein